MNIKGLKTLDTVSGEQKVEVDGELAVQQVRIYTNNPYTAEGTIKLIYKVNTPSDGLIPPMDGGDKSTPILDPDLLGKTFNNIAYSDVILAIKECAKYIIGRDIVPEETPPEEEPAP